MSYKKINLELSLNKQQENQFEEQRKLQITGGSTFILSLPKNWAIKNELKRGSSMIVREENDGRDLQTLQFPRSALRRP